MRIRTREKRFLAVFAAALVALVLVYHAAFRAQLGSPVVAEWWLKNMYDIKGYIAESAASTKVIILSGSNSLFGINSGVMADSLGMDVVNLAGHSWLNLDFFRYLLDRYMDDGDIVVMPLEARFYQEAGEGQKTWFTHNMIAWGGDYLRNLSWSEYLAFLVRTPDDRVLDGLAALGEDSKTLSQQEAIDYYNDVILKREPEWKSYGIESLNRYGEINVDRPPTPEMLAGNRDGSPVFDFNGEISGEFLDGFERIARLVEERHGRLVLTWPVSLRHGTSDLSLARNQAKADSLRKALREQGIEIYCNPALFNLGMRFFFDMHYHPNTAGVRIRSENLAYCLHRVLTEPGHIAAGFDSALHRVREKEAHYPE